MMYHLRHGADQFIVYLSPANRDFALRLLAPFIDRKLVTIVLINSHAWPQSGFNADDGNGGFEARESNSSGARDYRLHQFEPEGDWIDLEPTLHNDCLHRFKGHTRLMVTLGYDEFWFAGRWHDEPRWSESAESLVD